jgi:hypothetical protein
MTNSIYELNIYAAGKSIEKRRMLEHLLVFFWCSPGMA